VTLTGANTSAPTFAAPALTLGQPAISYTFKLTVTDALGLSGSATTNVTVKPLADRITITAAAYKLAGSKLSVTATDNIIGGAAVLTLHVQGQPDVVMTYDPTLQTYNVNAMIVNPIPSAVSVTSSFGGSAVSGLTSLK
jgi:hypothetical protein